MAKADQVFIKTSAVLILVTGLAKLWSSTDQSKILFLADPVLGLPFGRLMLMVGLVECAVAYVCLQKKAGPLLQAGLLAWLATNFLAYRIILWSKDWQHPCNCMGSLAGALDLSDTQADRIMLTVLVFMISASYWLLVKNRKAFAFGNA